MPSPFTLYQGKQEQASLQECRGKQEQASLQEWPLPFTLYPFYPLPLLPNNDQARTGPSTLYPLPFTWFIIIIIIIINDH